MLAPAQDFGISWTNLTENSQGRVASFVDYDWGMLLIYFPCCACLA